MKERFHKLFKIIAISEVTEVLDENNTIKTCILAKYESHGR